MHGETSLNPRTNNNNNQNNTFEWLLAAFFKTPYHWFNSLFTMLCRILSTNDYYPSEQFFFQCTQRLHIKLCCVKLFLSILFLRIQCSTMQATDRIGWIHERWNRKKKLIWEKSMDVISGRWLMSKCLIKLKWWFRLKTMQNTLFKAQFA